MVRIYATREVLLAFRQLGYPFANTHLYQFDALLPLQRWTEHESSRGLLSIVVDGIPEAELSDMNACDARSVVQRVVEGVLRRSNLLSGGATSPHYQFWMSGQEEVRKKASEAERCEILLQSISDCSWSTLEAWISLYCSKGGSFTVTLTVPDLPRVEAVEDEAAEPEPKKTKLTKKRPHTPEWDDLENLE